MSQQYPAPEYETLILTVQIERETEKAILTGPFGWLPKSAAKIVKTDHPLILRLVVKTWLVKKQRGLWNIGDTMTEEEIAQKRDIFFSPDVMEQRLNRLLAHSEITNRPRAVEILNHIPVEYAERPWDETPPWMA
jgi:hypothetical protein